MRAASCHAAWCARRDYERQAAGFKERVRLHADQHMREFEERVKRDALGNASQAFADMTKALQKSHAEVCHSSMMALTIVSTLRHSATVAIDSQ